MKPHYKIGQEFIRRTGKRQAVETITDILTTYNSAGKVVKIRYITGHNFCGQRVFDYDVPEATIALATFIEEMETNVIPDLLKKRGL